MDHDPMETFFPGEEDVNLYRVMGLESSATQDEIKRAYRRLALTHHPDKHAHAEADAREKASLKFQQIGFAYTILSDDKRKQRYDSTGSTDEGLDLAGEDGWEAYFGELFDKVTKGKLDEMKKEYQGSAEEIADLEAAYNEAEGSIEDIMTRIPHSNYTDEERFISILKGSIKRGTLKSLPHWEKDLRDTKAKVRRKKDGEKEASEAEAAAKELGVWDEFYGSGKARKGKSKGKGVAKGDFKDSEDTEEDLSSLRALIQNKKKNRDGFFDDLAAKYTEADKKDGKKGRGGIKRRKGVEDDEHESPNKKMRSPPPPDIDDEEFERLQQKLFGEKSAGSKAAPKVRRAK